MVLHYDLHYLAEWVNQCEENVLINFDIIWRHSAGIFIFLEQMFLLFCFVFFCHRAYFRHTHQRTYLSNWLPSIPVNKKIKQQSPKYNCGAHQQCGAQKKRVTSENKLNKNNITPSHQTKYNMQRIHKLKQNGKKNCWCRFGIISFFSFFYFGINNIYVRVGAAVATAMHIIYAYMYRIRLGWIDMPTRSSVQL